MGKGTGRTGEPGARRDWGSPIGPNQHTKQRRPEKRLAGWGKGALGSSQGRGERIGNGQHGGKPADNRAAEYDHVRFQHLALSFQLSAVTTIIIVS
jgi:hypothetical protein